MIEKAYLIVGEVPALNEEEKARVCEIEKAKEKERVVSFKQLGGNTFGSYNNSSFGGGKTKNPSWLKQRR